MDIFPIWKSTFYETEEDSVKFRILKWGVQEICRATAVRLPDDELLRIGLNKPCQNYLDSNIDVSATGTTSSNAYAEFSLQIWNASNSQWFNAYEFAFVNDWSYGEHEETGSFSEPINGHAAPGQLIPYTICSTSTTQETICYDEYDRSPYISLSPSSITFNYTTGSKNVTIVSNCSWELVSITNGFHISQTTGSPGTTVVTITADENSKPSSKPGTARFVGRNQYGTANATLNISQSAAPVYFNVTSGDGVSFDGYPTTWTITYETNLDTVYYEFSNGTDIYRGTTGGTSITFEIPASDSEITYTVRFYRYAWYSELDNASAIQIEKPLSLVVSPTQQTYVGAGTTQVTIVSSHPWTASVPSGITLSQVTGDSGTTIVDVSFSDPSALTEFVVTFSATHDGHTVSEDFTLNLYPSSYTGFTGDYLTFEFLEDSTWRAIRRTTNADYTTTWFPNFSASTDNGVTWFGYTNINGRAYGSTYRFSAGSKLLLKGSHDSYANHSIGSSHFYYLNFETTGSTKVSGDIMSMFQGFTGDTLPRHAMYGMFRDYEYKPSIVDASGLLLPRIKIGEGACARLFASQEKLEKPPVMPAKVLGSSAYAHAFEACTSLEYAPALPEMSANFYTFSGMFYISGIKKTPPIRVTEYRDNCFEGMFESCHNLESAVILVDHMQREGRTIAQLFLRMFMDCEKLKEVSFPLIEDVYNDQGALDAFMSSVSSTGTFVKNSNATWPVGAPSGVPTGWTIVNA